ncbi:MAG: cytidylyltransferase domain-containing protein [Ignavibacteriales bacterium]
MKILITICARGGSKGIPGKNIKQLNGKPLLAYTIDVARKFQNRFESVDIELSTDSQEILKVASDFALKTEYCRPEYLAGDTTGKIDAIKDIVLWKENKNNVKYDFVLDLDVTSPLRNLEDLVAAFDILRASSDAINLFSVSPASRSPYFNMVEQKASGFYNLVKQADNTILTRQSAPKVYDLNASFYFYRRSFFEQNYKGAITDRSLVYVVPHSCFDLDHPVDFEIMSFLIENNRLDFEL